MFKKWFGGGKKDSPKRGAPRVASINLDFRKQEEAKRRELPPKFAQSVIESEIEVTGLMLHRAKFRS